ncbi:MAG: hypothetical protein NW224_06945 [Leptolyngbyaceae cyanobacterium bins.302]|nr:hypothetical protein [Leptolyngbyaceae cyanobacterium bins.302]
MQTTLNAKDLTLNEVHRLLKLERDREPVSFSDFMTLEPLTDAQSQEIAQIVDDFEYYLRAGKVLEGQIQFLVLAPLLRLAGFYRAPIYLSLEQGIAEICIEDEDTSIRGRMDILAAKTSRNTKLWMLVVETKNSEADALNGLPQLLTYAHSSLEQQESVWGLTTNGISFRFVHLQAGNPATYRILPEVNLVDRDRALQLLQVLNALCKL